MEPDSRHPESDTEHELLRHAAWIKRLALGLVGDAATAEDVVQDTWVAALRRPPPTGRALRPWLRTVVTNAARQGFRGGGRRAQRESDARAPEPIASPDELAERLETERRLTDELARLDEPFRSTLMLRYYEGLEPSEIARRLEVPAGTVRWRVSRGLELLRERMDRRFGKRAHWCALMMPLAGMRELTPVAAAAVPGVLAMHAISKIGIGAAGVVAFAVTLGVTGLLPESLWPLRHEAPAALAARPYVPSPEPELLASSAAPAARVVVDQAPPAMEPAPSLPAEPPVLVEARVVHAGGGPFVGATLREVQTGESAASTRDGHVQLALEAADEAYSATFELGARGYASQGVEAVVTPGERVHLGVLELLPGGAVSGRVLDGRGEPLAGVRIRAGEVEVPRRVLDALRLHPEPLAVPAAATRADGTFMLEGLRDGQVRIWAAAEGYLASYSPPVQVQAGEERYGLELRLDPIPPENHIAVAVVDPDGAPVPHAQLDFRHESESTGTTVSGNQDTDATGRHVFIVPDDALLWVTAEDPELRYGPASAAAVRTGGAPLVLCLTAVGRFTLNVNGEDGVPALHFGFAVLSPDGSFEYQSAARARHDQGSVDVRLPSDDFMVEIDASGHELAQAGPFKPSALGDGNRVDIVLARLPGVHGRVSSGERPVAGARVRMHALVKPDTVYEKNGFVSLWHNDVLDEVESDDEGRFMLTPRRPGEYVARAEMDGLAPAVSEPIGVGAGLSAPDLELTLTRGGAIEGRVIPAAGNDPAGTIVGLTRGDGYDRTVRVGPDGAYRFERLTPGPWRVLALAVEIRPGSTTTSISNRRGKQNVQIEWTCTVSEGRTSVCDLVLGDPEACVLNGKLAIDGAPPGTWQAWLVPEGRFFAEEPEHRTALDPKGRFRLAVPEVGSYNVVLTSGLEDMGERFVLDVVQLGHGERSWEFGLETGTLVVTNASEWDGQGVPAAVHLWEGEGSTKVLTVLAGNASSSLRVAVPAGRGRIVRPDSESLDFTRWPTLIEVEVPKRGEATAQLP